MGKPKRKFQKTKQVSALGSDDEELYGDLPEANPKSREFFYSEIDEFNNSREHIPLDSDDDENELTSRKMQEEVLPLPDDSDDDDEEDGVYDNKFYSAMVQKDEIASDIDDDDDDADDNLPNEKAWGKRKSSYYNTDYVDKDYDGYQGTDVELAEAEEKEATRIQKRLLQELSEEDFGLEWISPVSKTASLSKEPEKQKIASDLSSLSENEKLELLKKESPELLFVVKDFKQRMNELRDKILPLIPLVENGQIPPGPGADYLTIKKKLIYTYCTNISFYLMIRCKDINIRRHPVVKRLLTFRKLLDQLEPVGEGLEREIQTALRMLREGKQVKPTDELFHKEENEMAAPKQRKHEKKKKRVSFFDEKEIMNEKMEPIKAKKAKMETADEKAALEMYELMKKKNRKTKGSDDESEEEEDDNEAAEELAYTLRNENAEVTDEKREITYQIAKNKGLTPHRKKEYRNPRVRHRVKFQKAKVRRKGQYKEPRKEMQRYGGEVSGIRIGSKRGIKLK